jgi:transcriptional regulator with XRE-family HTH domain
MKSDCGAILREWRAIRRLSQLDLALTTNISQKHLSFVESGRARPSRDMILKLANGLELPLRAGNDLLLSAGYAPVYPERQLDLTEMQSARGALEMMLTHQEPFPALVMDASWNIIMINRGAERLVAICVGDDAWDGPSPSLGMNFMQLMFSQKGLRPCILNWSQTRAALLTRLRREARANPGCPSAKMLVEFEKELGRSNERDAAAEQKLAPVLSLELLVRGVRLRLFSTFTTFGLPQDITLQELRIDMSFPADEATRHFLVEAAAPR